jgi:hypothetical protein
MSGRGRRRGQGRLVPALSLAGVLVAGTIGCTWVDGTEAARSGAVDGSDGGSVTGASKAFAESPRGNDSDASARLVGLDAKQSSGVESMTFTFADTKVLPKYLVKYVDAVRQHPEGDPVALPGSAFLQVGFALTNPNTHGRLSVPPDVAPAQPLVKEILLVRNLDGDLAFGVGLDRRAPFRVRELSEPTRLVVEVRTK